MLVCLLSFAQVRGSSFVKGEKKKKRKKDLKGLKAEVLSTASWNPRRYLSRVQAVAKTLLQAQATCQEEISPVSRSGPTLPFARSHAQPQKELNPQPTLSAESVCGW